MGLDYYAVLDIPRDATIAQIKLAYRKWAIATHPQREPYPQHPLNPPYGLPEGPALPSIPCHINWELVNEAYEVLLDPLTRQVFDVYGEEGLKTGVPAPDGYINGYRYHGNYMETYCNALGTVSPYADLIDAISNPPPLYATEDGFGVIHKDKDVEKLLELDLKEVFYGGIKKMKIYRHEFIDDTKTVTEIREKQLDIPFPPGILPGTRIKFTEQGDQGPTRIPADIIFVVTDKPHETFIRRGTNLEVHSSIDLIQALCGFTVVIHTIDDRKIVVPITDVVTNDYVKTVNNEGLPCVGNNNIKGDLSIKFNVVFPKYIERSTKLKLAPILAKMYKSAPRTLK